MSADARDAKPNLDHVPIRPDKSCEPLSLEFACKVDKHHNLSNLSSRDGPPFKAYYGWLANQKKSSLGRPSHPTPPIVSFESYRCLEEESKQHGWTNTPNSI
jgi:hypothetical protein